MGYSRKIIGKNRNLRKRSRKGGMRQIVTHVAPYSKPPQWTPPTAPTPQPPQPRADADNTPPNGSKIVVGTLNLFNSTGREDNNEKKFEEVGNYLNQKLNELKVDLLCIQESGNSQRNVEHMRDYETLHWEIPEKAPLKKGETTKRTWEAVSIIGKKRPTFSRKKYREYSIC